MRQIAAIFTTPLLDDQKKILFKDLQGQAKGQKFFSSSEQEVKADFIAAIQKGTQIREYHRDSR
jgi:hypothetical protein